MAKAAVKRSGQTKGKTKPTLNGQEAIEYAKRHLLTFIDEEDLIVEEAEVNENYWWITFSMPDRSNTGAKLFPLLPRKYKVVKIKSESGEFVSMSVRDIYDKK